MLNYAIRLNGIDSIALTKLDILSGLKELKICTAYGYNGKILRTFPFDAKILEKCEPIYETLHGWPEFSHEEWQKFAKLKFERLPKEIRNYILLIERLTKTPISLVSFGPDRNDTFIRHKILV